MLQDKRVVVTGAVAGESRASAEQKLREAGALVQSSVGKDTDLLITGARVGASKIRKATELDVEVVTWEQAWSGIDPKDPRVREVVGEILDAFREPARQIGPMLAKAGELPTGEGWLYEVKWDGFRCVATVQGGRVAMQSRSGKSEYVEQFPTIAAQLAQMPDGVYDGELVVLDTNGHSSFADLIGNGGQASYVLFDLLELDGVDFRGAPLEVRREALGSLELDGLSRIAVSPTFDDGEALMEVVRAEGLEGLVAKRLGSRYMEGKRSEVWTKVKVRNEQEFVVVGWTEGEGMRAGSIGSVLLGYYEGRTLVYAGRAGAGGTYDDWKSLRERLTASDIASVDTSDWAPADRRRAQWVEPEVVVQVAFQRWTVDGRLWHPVVLGVREDKSATDVGREA